MRIRRGWIVLVAGLTATTVACSPSSPELQDTTTTTSLPASAADPSETALTAASTASDTPVAIPPALQAFLPDDLFTAPAEPLDLDVVLDQATAASGLIGAAGGVLSATGADGTAFTLTVPAGAFAMDQLISITPVASVSGFPEGASPARTLGISLEPDGVELGIPASLVMTPAQPLPPEATSLTFQGLGTETGFYPADFSSAAVTFSLDHFSGYVVSSPLMIGEMRPTDLRRYMTQSQVEARFQSEVAAVLAYVRQAQILGVPTDFDIRTFARAILTVYKRLVVSPRVAAADRSCNDAQEAMRVYLVYQRQRQLLGVADDPEFDLVGAGLFVPSDLIDIAVARCFEEQYKRCAAYGDFRTSAAYFLTFFQRLSVFGIEDPKPEHLDLAVDYLSRCGRWRVRLATTLIDDSAVMHDSYHLEATRQFYVQWTPNTGGSYGGIVGSTIVGSGPVETTLLERQTASCQAVVATLHADQDATGAIQFLAFDQPAGPTQSGELLPPVPTKLTLQANFGAIGYQLSCVTEGLKDTEELFQWSNILTFLAQGLDLPTAFGKVATDGHLDATFDRDWRFDTQPYRATTVQENSLNVVDNDSDPIYVRNELVVEHSPT